MKIRELKPYSLGAPGRTWVLLKVITDEGLFGWGEATLEMKTDTVLGAIKDLERFVLGQDPTRIDFLWNVMHRHGFWRGGAAVNSAMSAIEQALWDITGKALNAPVYKLLGGPVRDRVPAYTHCRNAEQALRLREEGGWTAFKSGPRGSKPGEPFDEEDMLRTTAEAFGAMRTALGDDVKLMCDCHGRFRPSAAIRLGKALEPYNLTFFEEPVPPDSIAALVNVRRAGLSMDIATGERAFTKWGFREMLEQQLVDVIQPDICHCGGIKELLKIGALAETYYVAVAPHNPNGPVGTAASVHAAACLPTFTILEYALTKERDLVQAGDVIAAKDGYIELPTKPGLGIDLDEEYIIHYTHQPMSYRGAFYADGGVADV